MASNTPGFTGQANINTNQVAGVTPQEVIINKAKKDWFRWSR